MPTSPSLQLEDYGSKFLSMAHAGQLHELWALMEPAAQAAQLANTSLRELMSSAWRCKEGRTLATTAAMEGHAEIISALAAVGVDLDARDANGVTPVGCAAANGHARVIVALEVAGVKLDVHDAIGRHPMCLAAGRGHVHVMQALMNAGVDLSAASNTDGATPAHCAAFNRCEGVIEFLFQLGADLNGRTQDGMTPMHLAANNGDASMLNLLRDTGLYLMAKDADGNTPVHYAEDGEHYALASSMRNLDQARAQREDRVREWIQEIDPSVPCEPLVPAAGADFRDVLKQDRPLGRRGPLPGPECS